MYDIGGMAFWLLVFSALILVGAAITPLVEKMLVSFSGRVQSAGDKKRMREIAHVGQVFATQSREPDKYRDPQLDELILAGQLDEAASLAAERLRLALERGLDERMEFYREYLRRIEAARLRE